jgi:hypothetical protein
MSTIDDKKAYKEALIKFRTKHFVKQMEKNMKAEIAIRDNPDAKHKDITEAVKIISRMLGALSAETSIKTKATAQKIVNPLDKPLTKSEVAELDAYLN